MIVISVRVLCLSYSENVCEFERILGTVRTASRPTCVSNMFLNFH